MSYSTVHFLFIIQKNRRSTRAWPIVKSNCTSFWFKHFFLGWIIKKIWKGAQGGPTPISLRIEHSSSNWFHSNTLNSRHLFNIIQIVDRNMYLIHFYIKNSIKMHFSKVEFLKFQNRFRHSLSIATRWNKLCWHQ